MSNLLSFPAAIPDAAAREQALDITRSLIVEAPAGSGKTGLLIQRFLKLLASESVSDPAQVLAITFTRKATHEMRDRVISQLAAAARGTAPAHAFDAATRPLAEAALARDQRLGWGLLDDPGRLNISTIDGFCTRVGGSLPVFSGVGGQSPVDEAGELYAEAAHRTLNQLGGDDADLDAALRTLLLHRDGSLAECQRLIGNMLAWRDQWGDLVPLSGAHLTDEYLETVVLPRLEAALELAICRALTRLDKVMPPALCHELASLARRMASAEGYQGADSPLALCRELKSAPGTAAADLGHWRALAHLAITPSLQDWRKPRGLTGRNLKFELSKGHKAELEDLIASLSDIPGLCDALCALTNLPPLKYPAEQWYVAKALFRVLSRALAELQLVFEVRGECDFTQFSLVARDALRRDGSSDDLSVATGFSLQHLLVDEMQDTSSSQYELIRLLTEHWDGGSQTVFLVGDPKQSIYLFRQARVERFIDTLRAARLGDLPLTPLYLTANFRSQENLVEKFNETFSQLFPAPDELGNGGSYADSELVPYRSASAIRKGTPGPDIRWHTAVLPFDAEPSARAAQLDRNAAEIRALLEEWQSRVLPPGRQRPWQIAVLIRNRAHLRAIVRAFKSEPAIPYRGVKTEPLSERQEILDLVALTRALLHQADRTAWLALLRTPWCGLTLRDLHLLAGQDDEALRHRTILDLIAEGGDLLSADGVARLQPFWTVLTAAMSSRGGRTLSQWVEHTWRAFGADRFATGEELLNIEQYLHLLDEVETRPGPITVAQIEQRLGRLYAAESLIPDAVELMTIHNAKGLEWDFVVIPELESGSGRNPSRLLSWLELDGSAEIAQGILAPVQPRGEQALALNKWMRSIEAAREAAERKRLFYVACTRAREELHLFAAPSRNAKGEIGRKPDSLLAAAWPAAAEFFEQPAEEFVLDIAAAATRSEPSCSRPLERIPLDDIPAADSSKLGTPGLPLLEEGLYHRPEGSFEARILGNATHAFLELLTARIAGGATPLALLAEVRDLAPRITSVLRGSGLSRDRIVQATATVARSLTRMLEDPTGLWILSPHPLSASEAAIGTPTGTLRLDRSFLAGAQPLENGVSHRWIIDYKTGTHAAGGLDEFLAEEKRKYAPQLEIYAGHLKAEGLPVCMGLYYPAIPSLIWWRQES